MNNNNHIEYVDFNTAMKAVADGYTVERFDSLFHILFSIKLDEHDTIINSEGNYHYVFEKDDILATNWVIKEKNRL